MPEPARQPASARDKQSQRSQRNSAETPRGTQRERLVRAMIELSAEVGYQGVTVAQVSSLAGVSSATFYELFEGKEDCLLAAYQTVSAQLFSRVRRSASGERRSHVVRATLAAVLTGVQGDPNAGRLMFVEGLAGGPRVRTELARVLESFETRAEARLDDATDDADTLDIPAIALVGAVRSIVARHLRTHSEDLLPSLLDDMIAWVQSYAVPSGQARWSTGPRAHLALAPGPDPSERPSVPERLPRGRHGLPASAVARSQRTRIINGIAEVMLSKGYANATVSDIVTAAGVAREAFYQHFSDKQHAFLEAQQFPTQYILDTCVSAYFAEEQWPDRVWNGLKALLGLIADNPAQAHLRLVECYAAGPAAARRAEEITRSFTIFLEEGYRYRPEARTLPRLCSQTIAGALFEVIQRTVARGQTTELPRYLPLLAYLAIAPFTGPQAAVQLLEDARARAERTTSSPA